jgi:hypothetical protein
VLVALEQAPPGELPGPADALTFIPDPDERPDARRVLAYARRVPGHNLWVWYLAMADDVRVRLVALTNIPP